MRILLAHHDCPDVRDVVTAMADAGFVVDRAKCGDQTLEMLRTGSYAAVLLASDLLNMSGLQVLRLMRDVQDGMPVLLLLENPSPTVWTEALRVGADDVVTRAVEPGELIACAWAVLRSCRTPVASNLQVDDLIIDPVTKQITCYGQPFKVTVKEFEILHLLALRRDSVVSKHALMNHLYGGRDEPEMKVIDVFISRLRKKLQRAGINNLIATVKYRGYMMCEGRSKHAP